MILAADNIHALNPQVADALARGDREPLARLARRCEEAGALLLDLNPGYLSQRNEHRFPFLVEAVREVTDRKLILDSPSPRLLKAALAACGDVKPVLNALSLEKEKLDGILPLAAEHGLPLTLLLMDERSFTPPSMEEKLGIALELWEACVSAGIPSSDLYFDPVLPNLSWPDAAPRIAEAVKTVRMLASGAVLGETVKTIVGLSNLRSGLRNVRPVQMDTDCLTLLAGAGLDVVLMDVLNPPLLEAFSRINGLLGQS